MANQLAMAVPEPGEWVVAGSRESHDTVNPINAFMEVHFVEAIEKSKKELFPLAKGLKRGVAACSVATLDLYARLLWI